MSLNNGRRLPLKLGRARRRRRGQLNAFENALRSCVLLGLDATAIGSEKATSAGQLHGTTEKVNDERKPARTSVIQLPTRPSTRENTNDNASSNDDEECDSEVGANATMIWAGDNDVDHLDNDTTVPVLSDDGLYSDENPDMRVANLLHHVGMPVKNIFKWENILAIMAVTGPIKFTVEQYNFFRSVVNWLLNTMSYNDHAASSPQKAVYHKTSAIFRHRKLPAISTLRRSIFPALKVHGLPHAKDVAVYQEGRSLCAAGHNASESDILGTSAHRNILLVQPSEWAKRDMAFEPILSLFEEEALEPENLHRSPKFGSIHEAPLVKNRSTLLEAHRHMYVELKQAQLRELITVCLRSRPSAEVPNMSASYEQSLRLMQNVGARNWRMTASIGHTIMVEQTQDAVSTPDTDPTAFMSVLSREQYNARNEPLWKAGDLCTIVNVSNDREWLCVLVNRHIRRREHAPPTALVWMQRSNEDLTQATQRAVMQTVVKITSSPQSASVASEQPYSRKRHEPTFGVLADGRRYGVYRCLLYCDGFNQYENRKGSAGGCYLLPLNLPHKFRSSSDSVRVLSLTPPGVSTKEVLFQILPDLVEGMTSGFAAVDARGTAIHIFLDVIGYVGDFPEITDKLDVIGHNGNCPCHLCSFERFNGASGEGSAYAMQTSAHSGDSAFLRCAMRTKVIRESEYSNQELQSIGLKGTPGSGAVTSPLILFAEKLRKKAEETPPPQTSEGKPVVQALFDPYRSSFISPDHMLAGIAINVMTATFRLLPSNESRSFADALICDALRWNKFIPQQSVYSISKQSLHAMSLSGVFCVLLFAHGSFKESIARYRLQYSVKTVPVHLTQVMDVLHEFSALVSMTYWYPRVTIDGVKAVDMFNEDEGRAFMRHLLAKAEQFRSLVNELCRVSDIARRELDKPNIHRLLELYVHSIPALGHVRHFAELLFEKAHQPLKKAIRNSNHRNADMQAVKQSLMNDWVERFSALVAQYQNEITSRGKASKAIGALLGGPKLCEDKELAENLICTVETLLVPPILRRSKEAHGPRTNSNMNISHWTVEGRQNLRDSIEFREYLDVIRQWFCLEEREAGSKIHFFQFSTLKRKAGVTRAHHRITRGHVVQALVRFYPEEAIVQQVEVEESIQALSEFSLDLFLIKGIFAIEEMEDGKAETIASARKMGLLPYAVVRRCQHVNNMYVKIDERYRDCIYILRLSEHVRRVALMHACFSQFEHGSCTMLSNARCLYKDNNSSGILHHVSHNIEQGALFYAFTSMTGNPPRMA